MRLQKANHVKDEFIAMLSHELRNPLAPIATTLQLMKLRAPDVLTRERSIIEDQVRHLTGLVNDLLDVARITNGKVELNNERVDIQRIIAAAVETVQTTLEEHRQSLHVSAEDGLIVSGDHRRLVQVLINLLDNAAKYSPPDRNIWLSAKAEAGQVVLRVRDEGRGIATDLLPRIFESFIQDPQSLDRSRGGLGLGLAIVHNLVTLHDGSISASSDGPYKGSEFVVRLPLLERVQTPGAAAVEMQPEEGAFLRKDAERIKVLIVDDYAPAAESLALLLQEMGYHTHVVHDGAAALQAMGQFEPQLALVDIGLPVIDGYEVAQTVRRTPGRENLPLIAITGYGQASDHVRVMEAGFDEHVVKPLDAAHVSELIEKMVTAG
jgi:CheY-like chemotaxis protein/two-component sensor histidine kinase